MVDHNKRTVINPASKTEHPVKFDFERRNKSSDLLAYLTDKANRHFGAADREMQGNVQMIEWTRSAAESMCFPNLHRQLGNMLRRKAIRKDGQKQAVFGSVRLRSLEESELLSHGFTTHSLR